MLGGKNDVGHISFSTNCPWKVSSSVDWCRVSPASGEGKAERVHDVIVTCDNNDGRESRECSVTISAGEKTVEVSVIQNHIDGLCVDVREYTVGKDAGELEVDIWTNVQDIELIAPGKVSWISMSKTKSMSLGSVTLSIAENTGAKRTASVLLAGGDKKESITIHQEPSSIDFPDDVLRSAVKQFDLDKDGHVSKQEALKASTLTIAPEVKCLDGIEYFSNLGGLNLQSNYISSFDFGLFPRLSGLFVTSPVDTLDLRVVPNLNTVRIYVNHKSLIFGQAESLQELSLYGTFESLVLSSFPRLSLVILGRAFKGPDLTDLSNIQGAFELALSCQSNSEFLIANSNIRKIIYSNTSSDAEKQFVRKLIIQNCPQLQTAFLTWDNGMEELVCSGNPALTQLSYYSRDVRSLKTIVVEDCQSLNRLSINGADLDMFKLSGLPELNSLYCSNCGLRSLDLTGVPSVEALNCTGNPDLHTVYCKTIPTSADYDKDVTSFVVVD